MPAAPRLRALTLDLDDTLWPIVPTIERAEAALLDWLRDRLPTLAPRFDLAGLRRWREAVARDGSQPAHDLSAQRREAIRRLLAAEGADEALAGPAFEVFFAARQRVAFYPDALPALQRLAARWPILALSNGNADLDRIGVARWFAGGVNAQQVGVGKPDRRIFVAACERLGCAPDEVLHVGDDLRLDVHGALDAGLQAAWVHRGAAAGPVSPAVLQAPDLLALADALGA